MTWIVGVALMGLSIPALAQAEPPSCERGDATRVVLGASQEGLPVLLEEVARHLTAGLSASGLAVCAPTTDTREAVAEVTLTRDGTAGAAVAIHVQDALTHKTLVRSIELMEIPVDSRALAISLYIEELLQASWAEIALRERVYLQEHPVATPPEVQREIESALPATTPSPRDPTSVPETRATTKQRTRWTKQRTRWTKRRTRWIMSLGAAVSRTQGGLLQVGPDIVLGVTTLPWLTLSLRAGYRTGPEDGAPHGSIRAHTVLAGLFLEPFWNMNTVLSLRLPQGVEGSRVGFSARADEESQGGKGHRNGVVVSHGAGLRIAIQQNFSITALARFLWTLLPAEAADTDLTVTGVAGLGGEAALHVDYHF